MIARHETTVGRALLSEILPAGLPFSIINKPLKKKEISKLINEAFRRCGIRETVIFADKLMYTGFGYATRAGLSICVDDLLIPTQKTTIIDESEKEVKEIERQYTSGLVTQGERYNKVVDIWGRAGDQIAKAMMDQLGNEKVVDRKGKETTQESFNAIYMMADSGARGSAAQIRQLAGMRGLMAKPDGSIIETPITANFREGLNVLQYFISTHGARKGLADTALKTANSGYLTRRLVDVTQDLVVIEDDCGTTQGMAMKALVEGGEVVEALRERILGRVTATDVLQPRDPAGGPRRRHAPRRGRGREDRVPRHRRGQGPHAPHLRHALRHLREVLRPRPRPRRARERGRGGRRHRRAVDRRAGHAAHDAHLPHRRRGLADRGGELRGGQVQRRRALRAHDALRDERARRADRDLAQRRDHHRGRQRPRARAPQGARTAPRSPSRDGSKVKAGQTLANWDPLTRPIITEYAGEMRFENVEEGVTVAKQIDETTGLSSLVVIDPKRKAGAAAKGLRPAVKLMNDKGKEVKLAGSDTPVNYTFQIGAIITVKNGQQLNVGDVLARIPQESSKTRDITGGLPRVAELFEARSPKDAGLLAEITGTVSFGKDTKGKQRLIITDFDGAAHEYLIPKDKHITVHDGQVVNKGEMIVDGPADPHDILRLQGMEALARYIIDEVQDVYRLQGVKINDKHIEVIVRQMLRRVSDRRSGRDALHHRASRSSAPRSWTRTTAPGPTARSRRPSSTCCSGITKASLSTDSFISAASFQETTRVLTEAAIMGKKDDLRGLKENVIVGRLIPAGTGLAYHATRKKDAMRRRARARPSASRWTRRMSAASRLLD